MEKQDVKRMQIVRHLKQQNTATRTTKNVRLHIILLLGMIQKIINKGRLKIILNCFRKNVQSFQTWIQHRS